MFPLLARSNTVHTRGKTEYMPISLQKLQIFSQKILQNNFARFDAQVKLVSC